jgi:hypothetical protein
MHTATRGSLRTIVAQLAVIAGVLHLGLGTYYSVGGAGMLADDLRLVLWAVAGAVLVGGVAVAAVGWHRRVLYKVGTVTVVALVGAHFLWPLAVGGNFYLGSPPARGTGPIGYLLAMVLDARPVTKLVLAVEVVLLALLVGLLADGEGP